MKTNIMDYFRVNRDVTPVSPRKRGSIDSDLMDPSAWKITEEDDRNAEVIAGLKSIAGKYDDLVTKKAEEYAEKAVTQKDVPGDDELLDSAKESLNGLYDDKIEALTKEREERLYDLNVSKQGKEIERSQAKENLAAEYRKAADQNRESLARKGMSHSSVADLTAEKLRSDYGASMARVDADYDRKVQSVDRKIEKLDAKYDEALKNYEISYAIKLEKQLNKLKAERDDLVDKFNAESASEKEKAYNEYILGNSSENYEYEKKNGDYYGDKRENYLERYDYITGELKGKSKSEVTSFIKKYESDLKKYLGLYYDRFIEEVK